MSVYVRARASVCMIRTNAMLLTAAAPAPVFRTVSNWARVKAVAMVPREKRVAALGALEVTIKPGLVLEGRLKTKRMAVKPAVLKALFFMLMFWFRSATLGLNVLVVDVHKGDVWVQVVSVAEAELSIATRVQPAEPVSRLMSQ